MAHLQRIATHLAEMRDWVTSEAAKGDRHTLDETIDSVIYIITRNPRSLDSSSSIASIDHYLHDLWHMFIEAAKGYHSDNPMQDRLIHQILYVREIGTLSQGVASNEDPSAVAAASNGQRVWSDLPYLAQDVNQTWREHLHLSMDHRCNLASWIARAAAVGICQDALVGCALRLFRDTLETLRKISDADINREVSIESLVPALNAWMYYAGHKLRRASEKQLDQPSWEPSELGELAQEAGVVGHGFSIPRWDFWETRLRQVAQLSQGGTAELALGVADHMQSLAEVNYLM